MDTLFPYAIAFLTSFFASIIGSIAGGGGLLSTPVLILLGLPAPIAVATKRFGDLGGTAGAIKRFSSDKKIVWAVAWSLAIASVFGALVGAHLLLQINRELLQRLIGIMMLALCPLLLLRKEIGIVRTQTRPYAKGIGYIFYFILEAWTAFFGGGSGIFARYVLVSCFGLTLTEASATDRVAGLVLAVTAVIIFAVNRVIDYGYGIVLLTGGLLGGYIGAHIAIKKGDVWVKYLFAILVGIFGIALLIK